MGTSSVILRGRLPLAPCFPLRQGAAHFVRDTSGPICSSRIAHVLKGVRETICAAAQVKIAPFYL